jgi:hypothetical protein
VRRNRAPTHVRTREAVRLHDVALDSGQGRSRSLRSVTDTALCPCGHARSGWTRRKRVSDRPFAWDGGSALKGLRVGFVERELRETANTATDCKFGARCLPQGWRIARANRAPPTSRDPDYALKCGGRLSFLTHTISPFPTPLIFPFLSLLSPPSTLSFTNLPIPPLSLSATSPTYPAHPHQTSLIPTTTPAPPTTLSL